MQPKMVVWYHSMILGGAHRCCMTIAVLLASIFSIFLGSAQSARAAAGVQAWVRRYSNPTDYDDRARKVVTDNAGNVIVAGYSNKGNAGQDMLVIKYSGAGVPLWTNRYDAPGNGGASAYALAADSSGNVLVTGYSIGIGSGNDYATIAYSAAGLPLWTNPYNGPGNSGRYPPTLAVDGVGNVFVTGEFERRSTATDLPKIS